jgi:hypothetical protein
MEKSIDEIIDKITDLKLDNNNKKYEHPIIEDSITCHWTHILHYVKYDGQTEIEISSSQIKNSSSSWKGPKNQFEPRLLCKQDSDQERPDIFKKYGLYIISIKNGTYLLTKTNIYYELDSMFGGEKEMEKIEKLEKNQSSILLKIGNSETSTIDNLRYSGLFEQENYLGEPILFGSLLNGRHRCSFKTVIGQKEIEISGSQYETDACYESENKILLIEAKGHVDKSFNIRQLYYPYRSIYNAIKEYNKERKEKDIINKEIISLFISIDKKKIINIWKFVFENPLVMTSIKCIGYDKYLLY